MVSCGLIGTGHVRSNLVAANSGTRQLRRLHRRLAVHGHRRALQAAGSFHPYARKSDLPGSPRRDDRAPPPDLGTPENRSWRLGRQARLSRVGPTPDPPGHSRCKTHLMRRRDRRPTRAAEQRLTSIREQEEGACLFFSGCHTILLGPSMGLALRVRLRRLKLPIPSQFVAFKFMRLMPPTCGAGADDRFQGLLSPAATGHSF